MNCKIIFICLSIIFLSNGCIYPSGSESGSSDDRTPFERVQQDGLKQPKKNWREQCKDFLKRLIDKRRSDNN